MFDRLRGWFSSKAGNRSGRSGSTFQWTPPPLPEAKGPAAPLAPPEPEGFDPAWENLRASIEDPAGPLAPVTPEVLERAAQLQPLLTEHFLTNLPSPASFPSVAVEVMDLLQGPDPDLQDLMLVVTKDPAISLHLLRVANSAYFARDREIQDLRSAVMRLGVRSSGEIALAVAGRALFDLALRAEYEIFMTRMMDLYHSSLAIAFGASEIAFHERQGDPNRAFLGGLFHDIGHSLAIRSLANLMISGRIPPEIEPPVIDLLLERVHLEVGYTAHTIWSLPPYLGGICARHHDPDVPTGPEFEDLHVVRFASGLHRLVRDPRELAHRAETRQSLQALDIPRERAAQYFGMMAGHRERIVGMFP